MKGISTPVIIGAGALGALYLFSKNQGVTPGQVVSNLVSSATNLVQAGTTYPYLIPGAPPLPSGYNDAYYKQFIRPAMVQANASLNNAGYNLSPADANTYVQNYTDVGQWANNSGVLKENQTGHTVLGALQYHWHTYGVPEQRTFLPLPWNYPAAWIPPQPNPKASGSGSSFGSILGTIASVAVAFAGPNDARLNPAEAQLIIAGAAVAKELLPMFAGNEAELVERINNKINQVINEYN